MKKVLILTTSNEFKNNKKYFYPYKGFSKYSKENNSYYLKNFSKKIKFKIYKDCDKIYNSLLSDVCKNLNRLHKINWPKRSWEIYLGHWLRRYVYIHYSKIYLIKKILNSNNFKKIIINNNSEFPLATKETIGIYQACKNSEWESVIFTRIVNEYKNLFKIEYSKKINKPILNILTCYEISRLKNNYIFKDLLFYLLSKISKLFTRENDILIIGSRLKFTKELIFNFKKKQFPQFWSTKKIEYPDELSIFTRNKLNFEKKKKSFVEKIIRKSLQTSLPISCIEGFSNVLETCKSMNFPKKPKKIYTCKNFDQDEVFKMHVAECISKNYSKYYIGQHGNNYFTKLDSNYSVEYKTCDHFISWGKNNFKKTIPLYNFKITKPIIREKKFLSIICRAERNNWEPLSRKTDTENDINIVKILTDHLPRIVQQKVVIKLKNNPTNTSDLKKNFLIFDNSASFIDLMKKTRIAFFNYDSTGFLENLNLDIPTIACWPDLFGHLNAKALEDYKKLLDSRIIFKSPIDAAKHISNNWKNVDEWWSSKEVKSTVNFFKLKYSKDSFNNNFVNKLSNIL